MLKSLFHWKVFLNLFIAIVFFGGLVWATFKWLDFHTHHGEEIAVPGVVNMTVHNAIKALDDAGLEYEVDSFKYDPKYKPFQVLQVFPSAGSRVKGGRTIVLKVNPRTWAKVAVPDVLDRYKGLAFTQLDLVGLKVGDTIYEPSIQRDAVIRMQYNGTVVKPGALLPRFSIIDLIIGTGPKRNVSVPNVVGLTVREAKAIIANNLFEVGLVEHEDGGQDDSDIVYYQDPEGGALRDQGMQVDLWASKKTPGEMTAKISELNSIYRVRVDTTSVSTYYYEEPTYYTPPPAPKPIPSDVPKTNTATATEKPKASTTPPANTDKPKTSETPKTAVEEQPKIKKKVIE